MNLFVVSDLHIYDSTDPFYRYFLDFLANKLNSSDILVIAGDLFDLFIGDKKIFKSRYSEFFSILEELDKKNVTIYYIEGNHDFHLKDTFRKFHHIHLISNEFTLKLKNKKFYFSHGDFVDTSDLKHLMFRWIIKSSLSKIVISLVPDTFLDKIGKRMSKKSRSKSTKKQSHSYERLRKIYRNFATEKMIKGFDYVILGHCHDLDEMNILIGDRTGQYINVGYPREHGSYLVWQFDQEKFVRKNFECNTAFNAEKYSDWQSQDTPVII